MWIVLSMMEVRSLHTMAYCMPAVVRTSGLEEAPERSSSGSCFASHHRTGPVPFVLQHIWRIAPEALRTWPVASVMRHYDSYSPNATSTAWIFPYSCPYPASWRTNQTVVGTRSSCQSQCPSVVPCPRVSKSTTIHRRHLFSEWSCHSS